MLVAGSVVVASAPVTEAGALSADATAEAGTVTVIGLREGAEGAGVLAVQQKLISFGYYVAGGADGNFGPGTTAALRKFQEQNGLNPTGVVTENTAKYLGLTGQSPPRAQRILGTGVRRPHRGSGVGRRPPPSAHPARPSRSSSNASPPVSSSVAAQTAHSDPPPNGGEAGPACQRPAGDGSVTGRAAQVLGLTGTA